MAHVTHGARARARDAGAYDPCCGPGAKRGVTRSDCAAERDDGPAVGSCAAWATAWMWLSSLARQCRRARLQRAALGAAAQVGEGVRRGCPPSRRSCTARLCAGKRGWKRACRATALRGKPRGNQAPHGAHCLSIYLRVWQRLQAWALRPHRNAVVQRLAACARGA